MQPDAEGQSRLVNLLGGLNMTLSLTIAVVGLMTLPGAQVASDSG